MLWQSGVAVIARICNTIPPARGNGTYIGKHRHGQFRLFHRPFFIIAARKLPAQQRIFPNRCDGKFWETPYKASSVPCTEQKCHLSSQIPLEDYTCQSRGKEHKDSWRQTLDCLDQLGIGVSLATYAELLKGCGNAKALWEGKRVHVHILKRGCEIDLLIHNLLVQMYGKCGALTDALWIFSKMDQRDLFSWTFIIAAYAQHGDEQMATKCFQQMQVEGVMPNTFTFLGLLAAFLSHCVLAKGKQMHAYITGSGFESEVVLATALVNMYGKCDSLQFARVVFDKMPARDIVSWNAMIAAYSHHGQGREALQLFLQMKEEGLLPNKLTYVSTIEACACQAFLMEAHILHVHAIESGFETEIVIGNALLNMYSKCGSVDSARGIFNKLSARTVVSWTTMITAYSQNGRFKDAVLVSRQMQLEGMTANKFTIVSILSACCTQAFLAEGKQFHSCIVGSGFGLDITVGNALLNMYAKCRSLDYVCIVFHKMPEKDLYSWNTMIAAYVHHGQSKDALQLFEQMQAEGLMPHRLTFITVVSAFGNHKAVGNGKQMHTRIANKGLDIDIVVGTALVRMYGKCGSLEDAWQVFNKLPQRDGLLWNIVIGAFAQHGKTKRAFELFQQMQLEGMIPDKYTFVSIMDACARHASLMESRRIHVQTLANGFRSDLIVDTALINMYGKSGSVCEARAIFDKSSEKEVVLWTGMIAAHARHGQRTRALDLFLQMQVESVLANEMTYTSLLSACASQAALVDGKRMHACIVGSLFQADLVVENALVTMYSKCGSLEDTKSAFDVMLERDVISWTSMISACSQHGQGKEALQLFEQMQQEGELPNDVTFVSILSACSHAGLVDEAYSCFASMKITYGIAPTVEHFNCLIDLLGRVGQLDKVMYLIHSMPFHPTTTTWMIMLHAYRVHSDMELLESAARHAFDLEPKMDSPYRALAKKYAMIGQQVDAEKLRRMEVNLD